MGARLLADGVLVAHFAFILFALLGGLLALRWPRAPLLHLPALAWGVFVQLAGRTCPLTPLENALRRAAGEQGYAVGFVEHYLLPALYPAALSHELQLVLAAALAAANAAIYAAVWRLRTAKPDP